MSTEYLSSKTLHPFWDRSIRMLLQRPERLRTILNLCQPDLAARLDFEHLELLDRSFILHDYRQREADLVGRLPYRSDDGRQEVIIYVLLEHQSTVDPWMPFRMLFYMIQVWDEQRQRAGAQDQSACLSPIVPMVFYTGTRAWTASRDFQKLIEAAPELNLFAPKFDIMYLGLPDVPSATLEAIGPLGPVLRAVQRIDAEHPEFKAVLDRAARAIQPLLGDEWQELAGFLYLLVTYRRPREELPELEGVLLEAAVDRDRQSELTKMSESLADVLLKEGREAGRREGLEEGRLAARREIILQLGCHRLGEPSPEQRAKLEHLADLHRLKEMTESVLEAESWDELLRNS